MIATLNSFNSALASRRFFFLRCVVLAFALALVTCPFLSSAQETSNPANRLATKALKQFQTARKLWRSEPDNSAAGIEFSRAAFEWAEFSRDNHEREEIANLGIDAGRKVLSRQPDSAAAHYYLAMNLGQLARTKSFGALKLVHEMETEFQAARRLDEAFDFAGPDRNLGTLYNEAPGWPTSIGNRNKARFFLQRAVSVRPNYPENHLALLEANLKWGEKTGAAKEFKALQELWPNAKKEFSGEQWESSWADWEKRWRKLQVKFSESQRALESPHGAD